MLETSGYWEAPNCLAVLELLGVQHRQGWFCSTLNLQRLVLRIVSRYPTEKGLYPGVSLSHGPQACWPLSQYLQGYLQGILSAGWPWGNLVFEGRWKLLLMDSSSLLCNIGADLTQALRMGRYYVVTQILPTLRRSIWLRSETVCGSAFIVFH